MDLSGWVDVVFGGKCDEISTSPRGLDILYKNLLAERVVKPEDGRYRPKHVVCPMLINTIVSPYMYSCVFD